MDSRVPVRHMSKTVCLVILLMAAEAGAQIDSPGWVSFNFLAEPDVVYQTFEQVPGGAELTYTGARAYLSSDASEFEDRGVRIWSGFDLAGPDGSRHAMLILDINLYDPSAVRAEYLETRNDRILFEGYPSAVEVYIHDLWLDGGDSGAVEGRFELIFFDPAAVSEGSRVLAAGRFITDTPPQRRPSDTDTYQEPAGYVETGCGSDVYVDGEYEDSGCEGDGEYESSGCGGSDDYDYGGSSDCEGDTYDSDYSDSSSCEGDTYDSYDGSDDSIDCEGDEAYAAVLKPAPIRKRRPNPLRAVMRMLPEIAGISFIVYMKRRNRFYGSR